MSPQDPHAVGIRLCRRCLLCHSRAWVWTLLESYNPPTILRQNLRLSHYEWTARASSSPCYPRVDGPPSLFVPPTNRVHIKKEHASNLIEPNLQTFSLSATAGVSNVALGDDIGVSTVTTSGCFAAPDSWHSCDIFFLLHGGVFEMFWDRGLNTPKLRMLLPHTQLRVSLAQHTLHGRQHTFCLHLSWQGLPQPPQVPAAFEQNALHTPHFRAPLNIERPLWTCNPVI